MRLQVLLLALLLIASGCGKKGALYLPEASPPPPAGHTAATR